MTKTRNTRIHLMCPIQNTKLFMNIKLLIYKSMIRSSFTVFKYGVVLSLRLSTYHLTMLAFQSISVWQTTSAPYGTPQTSNHTLYNDFKTKTVSVATRS